MPGPDFFQTQMGRIFYSVHVPKIAKNLERIADGLEKLIGTKEAHNKLSSIDAPYEEGKDFLLNEIKRLSEENDKSVEEILQELRESAHNYRMI